MLMFDRLCVFLPIEQFSKSGAVNNNNPQTSSKTQPA
jgi:hypothetical protein